MLFNTYLFLLAFLPIVLAGFHLLCLRGLRAWAMWWLVVASLVFYAWHDPWRYVPLIGASVLVNFVLGRLLAPGRVRFRRVWLVAGIAFNLGLLGYFKYANFLLDTVSALTGLGDFLTDIALPLGISFFTFQQIALLVDTYRGHCERYTFSQYCLFVVFFPQLVAGPIVHHREIFPQLSGQRRWHLSRRDLSVGLTIFVTGLGKKVLIADTLAAYANGLFDGTLAGAVPTAAEAWVGSLAYTLQLYFDFSGYSDMAIGLGRLFGIRLPLNFASPYKATSLIDFWRRWHMTLSRFLREYLYFPLGGSRRGKVRKYVNLMITMLLAGLWHGAGWTFVCWGGMHGVLLCLNHLWRAVRGRKGPSASPAWRWASRILTFLVVSLAWVFFRAETFGCAGTILSAMAGGGAAAAGGLLNVPAAAGIVAALLGVVMLAPNTQQVMASYRPAAGYRDAPDSMDLPLRWRWRPSAAHAAGLAALATAALLLLTRANEFIYWQF